MRIDASRPLGSSLLVACGGALLLLLASCGASAPVTVTPATHDFGRILLGEKRSFTFKLHNHGDRTVAFRAKANCGCFKVAQSIRPLDPGKELDFTVVLDTTGRSPQKLRGKYVTITTDHPDLPRIVVPLEGEVFRVYDLRPALFNVGRIDGRPKNYEPLKIIVRPISEYRVAFDGIVASPDVFDAEAKPLPSGGLEISLRLREGVYRPLGNFHVQVRPKLVLTSAEGAVSREEPIVTVRGLWALTLKRAAPK